MPDDRRASAPDSKAAARAKLVAVRRGLPRSYLSTASEAICERLAGLPELQRATEIHCFWPRPDVTEIDLRPLVDVLRARGKLIFLPVVQSFNRRSDTDDDTASRILEAPLDDPAGLIPNRWQISEPASRFRQFASDAAIVPGLGVGSNGVRVGQGWGYYDDLLAGTSAPVILPTLESCVLANVTPNPRDVPVTVVVTESRVLRNRGGMLM